MRTDSFRTDGQTDVSKMTVPFAILRTRLKHYTALELSERKVVASYTGLRGWKLRGYLEINCGEMKNCACVFNLMDFPLHFISKKPNTDKQNLYYKC